MLGEDFNELTPSQLSLKSEESDDECDDLDLSFLDTFDESSYLKFSKLWKFYY
jgi:hypothetical protein